MNCDRIVIRRTDANFGYYTIESEGRMSAYLCWGEMIEMLIHLTHSEIKGPRYSWRTVDEEMAEEDRRNNAMAKVYTPDENLNDIQPIEKSPRMYSCDVCGIVTETPINACGRADCDQIPF